MGGCDNVQAHQIFGGPKWIDSELFTIDARPSAATSLVPLEDQAFFGNRGRLLTAWTATDVGVLGLVSLLSQELRRPVSDKTGLTGIRKRTG